MEHWWDLAAKEFDEWLIHQPSEVQALSMLEQIDIYSDELLQRLKGIRQNSDITPS